MDECVICGAPWARVACADWCERVRVWLRSIPSPGQAGGRSYAANMAKRRALAA